MASAKMEGRGDHAIMYPGLQMEVEGQLWVENYLKNQNIVLNDLKKEHNNETFHFVDGRDWPTLYVIDLSIAFEDVLGEVTTIEVRVNVVEAEIPLFIGRNFLKQLHVEVYHGEGTAIIGLDVSHKYQMIDGDKGHCLLKLHSVETV